MIALIPAKGYSRRVPGKNKREFCGLPLVAWSIIQAKCSRYVEKVFVSTDDDEIADITVEYGGNVLWRHYKQDPDDAGNVPTYYALLDLLEMYGDLLSKRFVNLFSTSPLRFPDGIDNVVEAALTHPVDSVTQTLCIMHEILLYVRMEDDQIAPVLGEKLGHYCLFGQATQVNSVQRYLTTERPMIEGGIATDTSYNQGMRVLPSPQYYISVPLWQSYECDTPEDWEICETLMEAFILKGRGPEVYYEYARRQVVE